MGIKYRGILFQKNMARAAVAGAKTETRRTKKLERINLEPDRYKLLDILTKELGLVIFSDTKTNELVTIKCPYGKVGDGMYGRETTWVNDHGDRIYEAPKKEYKKFWKTIPSLFMPAEAARVKFIISEMWIERLRSITEKSAINEGITCFSYEDNSWKDYLNEDNYEESPQGSYFSLWDSINGRDSHKPNPWVWVIKWKELEPVLGSEINMHGSSYCTGKNSQGCL